MSVEKLTVRTARNWNKAGHRFGDAVIYQGETFYWESHNREIGFLYRREADLGNWTKRTSVVEAHRTQTCDQDPRFRWLSRQGLVPIELVHRHLQARLHLRFLYGKQYLEALRKELQHCGIKRGLRKIYLAEMNLGRLTSRKISVLRKLGRVSERSKSILLISDRPTRSNYQADPALPHELAHYLGRYHHVIIFSWDQGPSPQQLSALMGLLQGDPAHGKILVPLEQ